MGGMLDRGFFHHPGVWFFLSVLLLGACTYLPLRIKNDLLRNAMMRWVLVPVSVVILVYVYPVGIEMFRLLALKF